MSLRGDCRVCVCFHPAFLLTERAKHQLYLATRRVDVSVGRERYAPSSLPELITKPQPQLVQRNQ